jgi:hypothetical protein
MAWSLWWIFIFWACRFRDSTIVALMAHRAFCDVVQLSEGAVFVMNLARHSLLSLNPLLPHHFHNPLRHLIRLLIPAFIFFSASNHAVLY